MVHNHKFPDAKQLGIERGKLARHGKNAFWRS